MTRSSEDGWPRRWRTTRQPRETMHGLVILQELGGVEAEGTALLLEEIISGMVAVEHAGSAEEEARVEAAVGAGSEAAVEVRAEDAAADGLASGGAADDGRGV